MGNKYYDQLVNNDSHFEITFNDFEEFITFGCIGVKNRC